MRWIGIALVFVLIMSIWAYSLHQTARAWQQEIKYFQNIFKPSYPCIHVADSVLLRYQQANPSINASPPDSVKDALLYDLLDCIGYIDDFGADVKTIQTTDNIHKLEWHTFKTGSYQIIVTYTRSDSCIALADIQGLNEMLRDSCIAQSKKAKALQTILP